MALSTDIPLIQTRTFMHCAQNDCTKMPCLAGIIQGVNIFVDAKNLEYSWKQSLVHTNLQLYCNTNFREHIIFNGSFPNHEDHSFHPSRYTLYLMMYNSAGQCVGSL
jgi:hypothetical protein